MNKVRNKKREIKKIKRKQIKEGKIPNRYWINMERAIRRLPNEDKQYINRKILSKDKKLIRDGIYMLKKMDDATLLFIKKIIKRNWIKQRKKLLKRKKWRDAVEEIEYECKINF